LIFHNFVTSPSHVAFVKIEIEQEQQDGDDEDTDGQENVQDSNFQTYLS
jgi:hypothetical protein